MLNGPLHLKSIKVPSPDLKHNQHRTFYSYQKGYEEQKLPRANGARKRKGKGHGKGSGQQKKKSNFWPMHTLQSETLYILVPNPQ